LPNSADSPRSKPFQRTAEPFLVASALAIVAALAVLWFSEHGYILYYGDAQSHLNLARSLIDSRTPGYDQLGTVWLPVLHIICLPFVRNDWLWKTGLAGAIPVAVCFVIAGTFFYLAARESYGSALAATAALICLAANPNVLYLGSIPMTEIVFLAGLAVLLFSLVRFRSTQASRFIGLAIIACWWIALTRYDGWFLIPFAAMWVALSAAKRGWLLFLIVVLLAGLAPLYWMAHNWWETSNALDFYNGPYSAKAIQAGQPYPGFHNWRLAIRYYWEAGYLCSGVGLMLIGVAGVVCAGFRRTIAPVLLLLLTPIFYVWSIHSSGTPIFVPQLEPHGYYNSRYGIALVVFFAFAAGAIVPLLGERAKRLALLVPVIAIAPWLIRPGKGNWICWKESQVNSEARRTWTGAGANYLQAHYKIGQGILTASASGDVAGIFCRAGVPLRDSINVGNGPAWMANSARPDLVHQAAWAVAQTDDAVSRALGAARHPAYRLIEKIQVQGAPALEIYQRSEGSP
jgi:hypothetical protein